MPPTPYYEDPWCTIYLGDCRGIISSLSGVDCILTDPPYGIQTNIDSSRWTGGRAANRFHVQKHRPIVGDQESFDPAHLLWAQQCILWGANNYSSRLPDSAGWYVWDKRKGVEDSRMPLSDGELAWTNICKGVHTFRNRWCGLLRDTELGEHYHPTQKPVALMRWCLEQMHAPVCVLDPYMGAGSTLVAAKELGIRSIGIEVDEQYCALAVRRLRQESLHFPVPARS